MDLLLGPDTLHIPMPAEVMERWRAEARSSGFPLEQWVAQRVEGYLANRAFAGEVRQRLNELLAYRHAETGQRAIRKGERPLPPVTEAGP